MLVTASMTSSETVSRTQALPPSWVSVSPVVVVGACTRGVVFWVLNLAMEMASNPGGELEAISLPPGCGTLREVGPPEIKVGGRCLFAEEGTGCLGNWRS